MNNSQPWETYQDFADAHNWELANWLSTDDRLQSTPFYYSGDWNTLEIFQYDIVDYSTIADIEEYDIDIPYWADYDTGFYAIGITHYGTSWDYVALDYLN